MEVVSAYMLKLLNGFLSLLFDVSLEVVGQSNINCQKDASKLNRLQRISREILWVTL
jgi:hypothetical protein